MEVESVDHLPLGLWDDEGCATTGAARRRGLRDIDRCNPLPYAGALQSLVGDDGFAINAPVGRSR